MEIIPQDFAIQEAIMTLPSAKDTLQWKTFFHSLKSSDVLKISTSYQDGKLGKGEDYNVEEPGRKKREEQHTVSVGLTTRSKWFPFRVFTEIFILDFVQSSAAAAMARPRRNKKKQPFFPPTSFFFLVLVSLWLPCTAHSPTPPPQHSYPLFGCGAAAAALPLRW